VSEGLTSETGGNPWLWTLIGLAVLTCCCCCFFFFCFFLRRRKELKEKENELSVVQVTLGVPAVEPPVSPYGVPRSSFSMAMSNRLSELRRELSGQLPAEEQAVSTPLMEDTIDMTVPQQTLELADVASPTSGAGTPTRGGAVPSSPHLLSRATSGRDMRI